MGLSPASSRLGENVSGSSATELKAPDNFVSFELRSLDVCPIGRCVVPIRSQRTSARLWGQIGEERVFLLDQAVVLAADIESIANARQQQRRDHYPAGRD